ncbi:hypothetical protein C7974DRAFT_433417 [Boeremia exigua]|uniref:uncharacterized protein n=1 Tax=Boeremia exigua TaxID=749465 RepID=UPI001E8E4491|nr:uncharacterized protein C7974DRAFT_433417 [Boeremia exigua]KAH6633369.1 hypothetical protein C7974DRAFT_433417 [Boeremia exigua]
MVVETGAERGEDRVLHQYTEFHTYHARLLDAQGVHDNHAPGWLREKGCRGGYGARRGCATSPATASGGRTRYGVTTRQVAVDVVVAAVAAVVAPARQASVPPHLAPPRPAASHMSPASTAAVCTRACCPPLPTQAPGCSAAQRLDKSAPQPSTPQHDAQQWHPQRDEPTSKAHRVLGTSDAPMFHSRSRQNSTAPASPAYRTAGVSPEAYRDDWDDRTSAPAAEYPKRSILSKRSSSNILGNANSGTARRGSDNSTASYRLHPQASNSTMRSHYDAKSSPLSISQQTSNSAVRDMALRRGQPQIITDGHAHSYSSHEASPVSPLLDVERRKSKPARLDLSKLFPKPKTGDGQNHARALLSPTKMVNSPAAMSMSSEYFAQPMTREPTPAPKGHATLTSYATRRHAEHAPPLPSSPKRMFKRDEYDSAKVHVRRPPKGVQHWFDALDEDSDEVSEPFRAPVHAPQALRPSYSSKGPLRKTSLSGIYADPAPSHLSPRAQKSVPGLSSATFSHEDMIDIHGLTSPSEYSLQTQTSTQTKESTMSKHNLQDSSCMSFSSSEDEYDDDRQALRRFAVRKSLNIDDDAGEIVFGQAQAYEVRPNRGAERKMSIMSTSTSAATIDIMYSPEPFSPPNFSRVSNYSGSRRSSHLRQPSVILEDEDDRPRTAVHAPHSSSAYSIRSTRTSASEPQPRTSLAAERKMMAVTPEEEALLELMRKKRASMAKQSSSSIANTYTEHEDQRQRALEILQRTGRTPASFATESPVSSPVRMVEMKSKRKSLAASSTSSTHLTPPPRGRPIKTNHDANMISSLRDSSVSDTEGFNFPTARGSLPHRIATPVSFSPLDPFPPMSPSHTVSVASPTTIGHVSPLPSPITPGPRLGETRDTVKIASSDTSADGEEVVVLDTDLPVHIIKAARSFEPMEPSHQRCRTASSDADMAFPSVASNASSHSNTSSLNAPSLLTGRERSRHASRGSSAASMTRSKARNSVSDDVLAAWGSLGGTY